MVRRHRILETFLVRVLGLDWAEVHEDAEVLEHHVSDRVLEAIDRLVGHPGRGSARRTRSPTRAGRVRGARWRRSPRCRRGARAVVREIREADGRRAWRAGRQTGLVPGRRVRVRAVRDARRRVRARGGRPPRGHRQRRRSRACWSRPRAEGRAWRADRRGRALAARGARHRPDPARGRAGCAGCSRSPAPPTW